VSDLAGLSLALPGRVSVEPADRAVAATDRSGWVPASLPSAVVRAQDVDDVVATLRWASAHGVPVVPRGAGTGLAGGAVAGAGSVVLDLSGLTRIVDLRADDQVAVVEPGVLTADLDRAAAAHGLRYAPDPASAAISTIGGNIATNAGGLRCVKYGVTRDAVLGLDVVLADGTRTRTGRSTVKGVAGYDLTSLFVGSEGTLGVIVGATLRLQPLPVRTATAAATFATVEAAAAAASAVTRAGLRPAMLELLDAATLAALAEAAAFDSPAPGGPVSGGPMSGGALVIAQADGPGADVEIEAIAAALGRTATHLDVSAEPHRADELLAVRRRALPAIERRGRVLIEDIAVPLSRLAEAVTRIAELSARSGVPVFTFAHAGDGNLHPIVLTGQPLGDPGPVPAPVTAVVDDIFRLALDLGGTITGEHGVGLLKRDWLATELDAGTQQLHHLVKTALDPAGILNPGKALTRR